MADGFIWYELVANDLDKPVNFYKKVVGWDIKDSGMPGMKYMLFGTDGKDVGGMMTWAGPGGFARTSSHGRPGRPLRSYAGT